MCVWVLRVEGPLCPLICAASICLWEGHRKGLCQSGSGHNPSAEEGGEVGLSNSSVLTLPGHPEFCSPHSAGAQATEVPASASASASGEQDVEMRVVERTWPQGVSARTEVGCWAWAWGSALVRGASL